MRWCKHEDFAFSFHLSSGFFVFFRGQNNNAIEEVLLTLQNKVEQLERDNEELKKIYKEKLSISLRTCEEKIAHLEAGLSLRQTLLRPSLGGILTYFPYSSIISKES